MSTLRERLGLSFPTILLLAVLAVPRVVAHDLDLVGQAVNSVLVFAPLAIWLAVVVIARVPNPLLTLAVVGLVYGVLLAIGHQVLWTWAHDEPPRLGGNLADLPDAAHAAILRSFSVVSSVATGLFVGVAVSVIASLIDQLRPRTPEPDRHEQGRR